jgi:hypothetical protein
MKKLYMGAYLLCTTLSLSAQEVLCQKTSNLILRMVTPTVDLQYLIIGSSIQSESVYHNV